VLVSCGNFRIEAGHTYREVFTEDFVRRHCRYDNFLGSFSYLAIRRSAHRLDSFLPALQDWDFVLSVISGAQFGVLEEPLVNYYGHDQPRITNRRMNRLKGARKCYLKHRAILSKDERRWWISQMVFERALYIQDPSLRRAKVVRSVLLASACKLSFKAKWRSIARKAASLALDKQKLVAIRCFCISLWQRLGGQVRIEAAAKLVHRQ
jgi:hypothetical protein